jgi:antitoxin component of RelBE/YafQ-DinJ toxin-antitoxin module
MQTITINIDEEKKKKLQEKADFFGLKIEDFIELTLDGVLSEDEDDLENKIKYIFNKNDKLYEKLAK